MNPLDWLQNPYVFTTVVAWTVAWKAVSLWRSSRRGQRIWFGVLLITNTLGILDIIYIYFVARDRMPKKFKDKLDQDNSERSEKEKANK